MGWDRRGSKCMCLDLNPALKHGLRNRNLKRED